MENIRVKPNGDISLPEAVRKEMNIKSGDKISIVKNGDGEYTIKTAREMLFDKIKVEVFNMADELGLTTVEEIRNLTAELVESYEQAERGELLDGAKTLQELRASYGV